MTDATVEDQREQRRSIPDEGDQASLSPLSGVGLRNAPVGLHYGNPSEIGTGGGRRTPPPVPLSPRERSDGVPDQLPPVVTQSWMSFGGVGAAQILADYWLWEALLNGEPQLTGIVELGTAKGGFALYLAAQADARDLFFRTYDVVAPTRRIPGFVRCDIFAQASDIGIHLQRRNPLVLFCDGGNKPREIKTFSRFLTPESLIVVHDWGTEMQKEDVPENVTEVYGHLCDEIGSMSRCFKVKDE